MIHSAANRPARVPPPCREARNRLREKGSPHTEFHSSGPPCALRERRVAGDREVACKSSSRLARRFLFPRASSKPDHIIAARVANARTKKRTVSASKFWIRDPADRQQTDDLGDRRVSQKLLAQFVLPQQPDVIGLDDEEHQPDHQRKRREQAGGKALLRGSGLQLGRQIQAFTDELRQVFEYLHQVRAGLALQDQAGDEEPQIEQGHALAEAVQGFFQRSAQRQFFIQFTELHADRVERLLRNRLQPGGDVVAGLHGTVEQIDRVWQALSNFRNRFLRARKT